MKRAAEISRLQLSVEEFKQFEEEFAQLFGYFIEVQSVKNSLKQDEKIRTNELREDIPVQKNYADKLVEKFTKKDGRYLVAPKSLD
ncbi:Uncharacterised protein [Candidatus Gugararchaeum adminiculabundum]|nr:Uncharacterised protein [Candidatus Gugararchaeum adminiculabundum]